METQRAASRCPWTPVDDSILHAFNCWCTGGESVLLRTSSRKCGRASERAHCWIGRAREERRPPDGGKQQWPPAGRIDGSTKSARLRRTVPVSGTAPHANAMLRSCVFLLSQVVVVRTVSGRRRARFAFPRVGGTAPAPAPARPIPCTSTYNASRPATNVSQLPAPCQITAYYVKYILTLWLPSYCVTLQCLHSIRGRRAGGRQRWGESSLG
jgi:hypothetical protein